MPTSCWQCDHTAVSTMESTNGIIGLHCTMYVVAMLLHLYIYSVYHLSQLFHLSLCFTIHFLTPCLLPSLLHRRLQPRLAPLMWAVVQWMFMLPFITLATPTKISWSMRLFLNRYKVRYNHPGSLSHSDCISIGLAVGTECSFSYSCSDTIFPDHFDISRGTCTSQHPHQHSGELWHHQWLQGG